MKKKYDTDQWFSLEDDIPPSDIPILIYVFGKVIPAKHSHAKFTEAGMKHFFVSLEQGNSGGYITNISQWRKMPLGPPEPTIKEWIPD